MRLETHSREAIHPEEVSAWRNQHVDRLWSQHRALVDQQYDIHNAAGIAECISHKKFVRCISVHKAPRIAGGLLFLTLAKIRNDRLASWQGNWKLIPVSTHACCRFVWRRHRELYYREADCRQDRARRKRARGKVMGNKIAVWVLILGFGAVGMISTFATLDLQTLSQMV